VLFKHKLMICVIFILLIVIFPSQDQDKGIKFLAAGPHRTDTYESSW
jgi:hypothetical protein